jgi:hypothetical protein
MTENVVASSRDSGNGEAYFLKYPKGNCFANHTGNITCHLKICKLAINREIAESTTGRKICPIRDRRGSSRTKIRILPEKMTENVDVTLVSPTNNEKTTEHLHRS